MENEFKNNEMNAFQILNDEINNKNFNLKILNKKFLFCKYSSSQNYYYSKDINDILQNNKTSNLINYYNNTNLEEIPDFKKIYSRKLYKNKIKKLIDYYKYHEELPRIFIKNLSDIIHNYYDKCRRINYLKIKKKLNDNSMDDINLYDSEESSYTKSKIKDSLLNILPNNFSNIKDSSSNTIKDLDLKLDFKLFNKIKRDIYYNNFLKNNEQKHMLTNIDKNSKNNFFFKELKNQSKNKIFKKKKTLKTKVSSKINKLKQNSKKSNYNNLNINNININININQNKKKNKIDPFSKKFSQANKKIKTKIFKKKHSEPFNIKKKPKNKVKISIKESTLFQSKKLQKLKIETLKKKQNSLNFNSKTNKNNLFKPKILEKPKKNNDKVFMSQDYNINKNARFNNKIFWNLNNLNNKVLTKKLKKKNLIGLTFKNKNEDFAKRKLNTLNSIKNK